MGSFRSLLVGSPGCRSAEEAAAAAAARCFRIRQDTSLTAADLRRRLDGHAAAELDAGSVALPPGGVWAEGASSDGVGIGVLAAQEGAGRIAASVWVFAPGRAPTREPYVLVAQGEPDREPLPIASSGVLFQAADWAEPGAVSRLLADTRPPIAELAAHVLKVAVGAMQLPANKAGAAARACEEVTADAGASAGGA